MAENIVAHSAAELQGINAAIHDCWFEIDNVRFDKGSGEFLIPFSRADFASPFISRKSKVSYRRCFLRVKHVCSALITDLAQVGSYDLNEVVFSPETMLVRVLTGIPLRIVLEVDALEVAVEVTDEILGTREERRVFSDLLSKPWA